MPPTARYDEIADTYLAEVGESVADEATAGLLTLVGDVRGKSVLDLACGQGRVSRALAREGAFVTGLDLSGSLVEQARAAEREHPLGISYQVGDASGMGQLAPGSFDCVVCNFGLSDVDDLAGALDTVRTGLCPGGRFVFSILHPCFPGWGADVASSWPPDRGYFYEGWWRTEAPASRIRNAVGANHRTLSTYLNQLTGQGLLLDQVLEPPPPRAWLTAVPPASPVPTFLVVRSRRAAVAAGERS